MDGEHLDLLLALPVPAWRFEMMLAIRSALHLSQNLSVFVLLDIQIEIGELLSAASRGLQRRLPLAFPRVLARVSRAQVLQARLSMRHPL